MRLPHWHWPPGLPLSSSVVPVLIVVALLVGTWAVRHHALLRLFHQTEPLRPAADRGPTPSTSDQSVLFVPAQGIATGRSHADKSPQRV